MENGNLWDNLPKELCEQVVSFLLDADSYGYLRMVSKDFPFTPTESNFREFCLYVNQCCHVDFNSALIKWGT